MASEEAAASVMNYYASGRPYLHHQPIYIKYSNHKELETDNLPNQASDQAELQALNIMSSGRQAVRRVRVPETGLPPGQACVLRIIIDNLTYPITLEALYQIFSKFGDVLRIITFCRNNYFQALIQYSDPMHAYYAKMCLHGRSVYSGCCTLYVDFSKLVSLKIRYNNSKSRDFTRNDLPSGDDMEPLMAAASGTQNVIIPAYAGAAGFLPPMGFSQGSLPSLSSAPGACGSVAVMSSPYGEMHIPDVTDAPGSPVLLVRNLNPEAITPQRLFNLFGMYGDVHRVKIMFRKKGTALVQMADATQARLAVSYLNRQRVYGRVLRAAISKYQVVQLPREGQEDSNLTKDYTNSTLHRFKKLGTRNIKNIFPPSAVLQLSNIPPSVTVDHLKNLLTNMKLTVKAFRFFPNDSTMILTQLGSVEEGVHALIELHNYDLGENHHLRVSFSKPII
ncbi:PREDICTED: polypyrimidine tract-binding protein 3-like [Apaloderma vittatum]|uniref:polypyrimidine tract-binding protein 3-like n=1 Tax=Apaloderma vittatum TaxID=57397 RepID=UPI000521A3C0|nr:PREDICTED: polypyrimidine tract-binding protein 3-like [Apaloderma vittatum]